MRRDEGSPIYRDQNNSLCQKVWEIIKLTEKSIKDKYKNVRSTSINFKIRS